MAQDAQEERIRSQLRARGFTFCDDGIADEIRRREGGNAVDLSDSLPLRALRASTCDHPTQSIRETIDPVGERFWSSTGDTDPEASEDLLYEIDRPCSRLRSFGVSVYRATYQYGAPIYPPKTVRVSVGWGPENLWSVPGEWPVQPIASYQEFLLPKDVPPARYLKVHLVGKQQRQLNDNQYYHAIRFIGACGRVLSADEIVCYRAQQLSLRRANLGCRPGWSYADWQASHCLLIMAVQENSRSP